MKLLIFIICATFCSCNFFSSESNDDTSKNTQTYPKMEYINIGSRFSFHVDTLFAIHDDEVIFSTDFGETSQKLNPIGLRDSVWWFSVHPQNGYFTIGFTPKDTIPYLLRKDPSSVNWTRIHPSKMEQIYYRFALVKDIILLYSYYDIHFSIDKGKTWQTIESIPIRSTSDFNFIELIDDSTILLNYYAEGANYLEGTLIKINLLTKELKYVSETNYRSMERIGNYLFGVNSMGQIERILIENNPRFIADTLADYSTSTNQNSTSPLTDPNYTYSLTSFVDTLFISSYSGVYKSVNFGDSLELVAPTGNHQYCKDFLEVIPPYLVCAIGGIAWRVKIQ